MQFLNRFSIAARLNVVSSILVVALCAVAAFAWIWLSEVESLAQKTVDVRVKQMERMASVELNVTRVSLQIRHAILVRTPRDLDITIADIKDKESQIIKSLADYERAIVSTADRENFAKLNELQRSFWNIGESNVKLIQEGQKEEAFDMLVQRTIPVRNQLLAATKEAKERQSELLVADVQLIEADATSTRASLMALTIAIAITLAGFCLYLITLLRRRIAIAQQVADRVSQGDLTADISYDAHDEFRPLVTALETMQRSLTDVVSTVRSNADAVALASSEIAQGNNDLSARTEQQASALQETAASMEQLSSTIRSNADNSKEANSLALNASEVAARGGDVVTQVVATMRRIDDSSKKIAEITGVIDGIAFQTNILALNAAVEAARAGEQGRGFAVVASEVRSLAQRSAVAAKEIKGLIQEGVERIEEGTALADRAGTTMSETVESIRRVRDLIADVNSASREQSDGVTQIGEAVNQMDQVTQQNAALVEQSAAAANCLQLQAQQLVQSVSIFQLKDLARSGGISVHVSPRSPADKPNMIAVKDVRLTALPKKSVTAEDNQWATF